MERFFQLPILRYEFMGVYSTFYKRFKKDSIEIHLLNGPNVEKNIFNKTL